MSGANNFEDCAKNTNRLLPILEETYKQGQLLIQEIDRSLLMTNGQIKQTSERLYHLIEQFQQIIMLFEQQPIQKDLQTTFKSNKTAERKLISNILHHDIAQMLYAISLKLELIDRTVLKSLENRLLEHFKHSLQEMIKDAVSLAADIYPAIIDDLGFTAAIRSYVKSLENNLNRKLTVDIHKELDHYPVEFQHIIFEFSLCIFNFILDRHEHITSAYLQIEVVDSLVVIKSYISGSDLSIDDPETKERCVQIDHLIQQIDGEKEHIFTKNLFSITYLIPL